MGSREDPVRGTLDAGSALRGAGDDAVINLGYPWWLLAAVLIVFASLLYYVLRERSSRWPLAGLALVLAPLCTLAAVAVAVTLSATLAPLYEAPARTGSEQTGSEKTPKRTTPARTTLDTTGPRTTAPTASPSASPSASPTASPSASPTASPSASSTASPSP